MSIKKKRKISPFNQSLDYFEVTLWVHVAISNPSFRMVTRIVAFDGFKIKDNLITEQSFASFLLHPEVNLHSWK